MKILALNGILGYGYPESSLANLQTPVPTIWGQGYHLLPGRQLKGISSWRCQKL